MPRRVLQRGKAAKALEWAAEVEKKLSSSKSGACSCGDTSFTAGESAVAQGGGQSDPREGEAGGRRTATGVKLNLNVIECDSVNRTKVNIIVLLHYNGCSQLLL